MAEPGQEIRGRGSTIRFLETSAQTRGERVVVEIAYDGDGRRPPPHLHPSQEERFEVLEGEVHVSIAGEERVRTAGETFTVPAGTPHQMWSTAPARQRWETRPALRTESFLETLWGLQAAGTTAPDQMALTLRHFSAEFRLVKPPPGVQAVAFPLLAGVARVRGRRPDVGG